VDPELWAILMRGITDRLSGAMAPYNEDTINQQKAKLFAVSQGRAEAEKGALGRDLVNRNLSRSGIAVEQNAAIERGASNQFSTDFTGVLVKAAEENYKAKAAALTDAHALVQTKLQADLANARNSLDAQIAEKNAMLAWARIAADKDMLQSQLNSAYNLAVMGDKNALIRLLIQNGLSESDIRQYIDTWARGG
jgi:hypothetical protein